MSGLMIFQISFEMWGILFCFICASIIFRDRKNDNYRSTFLFLALINEALQLVSDCLAIIYRGQPGTAAFYVVRISNFIAFLTNFLAAILCCMYLSTLIEGISSKQLNKWKLVVSAFGGAGIILLIISQFTNMYYYFDDTNTYHRAQFFYINMGIALITLAISMIMSVRYRKNINKTNYVIILLYQATPFICGIIQIFFYGLSISNAVNSLILLLLFSVHEHNKSTKIITQEKILAEQQIELSEARMNILVSQIKPHFISNTLLMIQGLYNEGAENADNIMNTFISYLQENFSELAENKPVSIEKDVLHAMNYSKIVSERWADMEFEFDIKCDDFLVPSMTVQPLVENAVRHGLIPLERGGKIKVSTNDNDVFYCLEVEDNGVGFNVDAPVHKYNDNRKHIGLSNIRDRLKIMCSGTLTVTSEPGKGTKVTVKIPKENNDYDCDNS